MSEQFKLPQSYFDLLQKNQRESNNNVINPLGSPSTQRSSLYPSLATPMEDESSGALWDFLGEAAWGAASGVTWGASEWGRDSKSWEEMSGAERAGWIIGEGAGMMLPFVGPFALLGKGARAATKLPGILSANKQLSTAATTASKKLGLLGTSEKASKKIIEQATKIANKSGKTLNEVLEQQYGPSVQKALAKATKNDNSVQWLKDMNVAGQAGIDATNALINTGSHVIAKALKESGVKLGKQGYLQTREIATKWVDDLVKGKTYVNDIAEWVERGLRGSGIPSKTRDVISKYFGMAAQDLFILNAHGLGVERIKSLQEGRDMDVWGTMSHSAIMSFTFPVIRAWGKGGHESVQRFLGMKWNAYKKANYNSILDKHGDVVLRNLGRVMVNGSKNDLYNLSGLSNTVWKVGGKKLYDREQIIKFLTDKKNGKYINSSEDVITLLEKMRGSVNKELLSKWGPNWLRDTWESKGRMALGILAMNGSWMIQKGAWEGMDPSEISAHMVMSAIMTKSKGAWGRESQGRYMANFTPYTEALNTLGVKAKNVKDVIRMRETQHILQESGATFDQVPLMQDIVRIFDEVKAGVKALPSGGEYHNTSHRKASELVNLYDMVKSFRDGTYKESDILKWDKASLDDLVMRLNQLPVKEGLNGETITLKKMTFEDIMGHLTEVPANNAWKSMQTMFKELDGLGLDLKINSKGQVVGSIIDVVKEGNPLGNVGQINSLLRKLQDMGLADLYDQGLNTRIVYEEIVKKSGLSAAEFNKSVDNIISRNMRALDDSINNKVAYELAEHPIVNFLGHAKGVAANNALYRVVSNKGESSNERSLTQSLDNLFRVQGSKKYSLSIDDYVNNKTMPDFNRDASPESVEGKKTAEILDMVNMLRPLFNIRKQITGGASKDKPTGNQKIGYDELKLLHGKYQEFFHRLPQDMKNNMEAYMDKLYMDRYFGEHSMDARVLPVAKFLIDKNAGIYKDGVFYLPESTPEFKAALKREFDYTDKDIVKIEQAHNVLEKALGTNIIKRAAYTLVDPTTNRSFLDNINPKDYIEAARMLNNKTVNDFLLNAHEGLDYINTNIKGSRKELSDMMAMVENIIRTIDPAEKVVIEGVENPVKSIQNLMEKIRIFRNSIKANSEADQQISAIEIKLNEMLQLGIDAQNKLKVQEKFRKVVDIEGIDDPFKVQELYKAPIQRILSKMIESEQSSVELANSVTNKLYNATLRGRAGIGLTPAESAEMINNLIYKWHQEHINKHNKNIDTAEPSKGIRELLKEINDNGSFSDAKELLQNLNLEINKMIVMNNVNNPLGQEGVEAARSLDKGRKIVEHQKSVPEILQQYGLIGTDGKVDPLFQSNIQGAKSAKELGELLSSNIKDYIFGEGDFANHSYSQGKTLAEKRREWDNFRAENATQLLMTIINSKPIPKLKIEGAVVEGSQKNMLAMDSTSPSIEHPNTKYFSDKNLDVIFIGSTVSAEVGGKMLNTQLDLLHSNPSEIQSLLNNSFRSSKNIPEILNNVAETAKLTPGDINRIIKDTNTDHLFYVRLSPMNKLAFIGTEKNLNRLNKDFDNWFNKTLARYEKTGETAIAKQLKNIFGDLVDSANTSRHNIEIKLLAPYLESQGGRGHFDNYLKEVSKGNEAAQAETLAKLYKIGYLVDGGTTQPLNVNVLKWLSSKSGHPLKEVRDIARDIWKNQKGEVIVQTLDETSSKKVGDILNIETIVTDQLKNLGKKASGDLKDIINNNTQDVINKLYPSLENSLLDGAKFASKRFMSLIMAHKGAYTGDFYKDANGAKTIIFGTGKNQLLGKGYLIYHPDIAKNMPKGVDIMIGTESAKQLHGSSIAGSDIIPHNITGKGKDWSNSILKSNNNSRMSLSVDKIGVSFVSRKGDGVNISPSIFDFQSSSSIKSSLLWMGLADKMKNISQEWQVIHNDGGQLAKFLYDIGKSEGNPMDKGDVGTVKLILEYGAMPNNPIVTNPLRRVLRSRNYKELSTIPNRRGGEDNYIIPNILMDLSIPVFADIYVGEKGARNHYNRVTMQYGSIGISRHQANRSLGKGESNNINQEKFIYRDEHGVDVSLSLEGAKYEHLSTFYSNLDKSNVTDITPRTTIAKDQTNIKVTRKSGQEDYIPFKNRTSDKTKKEVESVLNEISNLVNRFELTYYDVFRLLKGKSISKTGSKKPIKLQTSALADKYNIEFGSLSHAIPIIGHDKVIMRVSKVNNELNGLVEVNVHDLRTIMQRDNDGDHLYTHTRVPFDIYRDFLLENGRKSDFNMLPTQEVLNRDYINIFGLGENNKAGEIGNSVGFHNYANTLTKAKMNMGKIIGMRNALSWLNRLDLQFNNKSVLHDLTSFKGFDSQAWKAIDTFYDIIQNSVDIHKGIHDIVRTTDALESFIFFGKEALPKFVKDNIQNKIDLKTIDPNLEKMWDNGIGFIKKDSGFEMSRINKNMFIDILRTLRKANMIQNDTWDEKGSRNPEPDELKNAFYDMSNLFTNPTDFLASKTRKRIQLLQYQKGKHHPDVKKYVNEYIESFHGKEYINQKGRQELFEDIIKGKSFTGALNLNFNFKSLTSNNPVGEAMDMSIGGHIMAKLLSTKAFWTPNYEGISGGNLEIYNKAGLFVRNIEAYVETARMLGENNPSVLAKNIDVLSFGAKEESYNQNKTMRKALNNGILKEMIQQQHANLMSSIEYFRAERFSNSTKLDKLVNRLKNLQIASELMDVQIAQDIIINKPDLQIKRLKKDQKYLKIGLDYLKNKNEQVAIYSIKGDIKPVKDDPANTLYGFEVSNQRINYGQLNFEGFYSKKHPFKVSAQKAKGRTYIVDQKPQKRAALSENDMSYARALNEVTRLNEIPPDSFIKQGVDEFIQDVITLRATLNHDHISTIKQSLSHKVLSNPLYAMDKANQAAHLKAFYDKWEPQVVNGADPVTSIFNYLIQPKLSAQLYHVDKNGAPILGYKMNNFLIKTVLNWAENNGHQEYSKKLISDWESAKRGEFKIDIGVYDRTNRDTKFDYEGSLIPNVLRTMGKHLNINFSSPLLDKHIENIDFKYRPKIIQFQNDNGTKVPVRNANSRNFKYSQLRSEGIGSTKC